MFSVCIMIWLCYLLQEARAEEQRLASKYMNEVEIAKAQRDFELKKAAYDREIFTAKAQSELAYDLQVQCNNVSHLHAGTLTHMHTHTHTPTPPTCKKVLMKYNVELCLYISVYIHLYYVFS